MYLNGIDFLNDIIKSIEKDNLVVFVGAGVSMGEPTNLPSFDNLARDIATGSQFSYQEGEPCDVFLGKMKSSGIDVNKIASKKLSGLNLKHNEFHKNILKLFKLSDSVRIVTTNYDHMLEDAAESMDRKLEIFNAPALPLGNDVSGIVHIHGNINNPQYMILTDFDFGNAYMVNGYVSRFLVDLFSSYTVLFLGYSYNDTIMRYLTRALVNNGEKKKYILTDNSKEEWEQLGIIPIKFPLKDYPTEIKGIGYLGEILNRKPSEWKRIFEENKNMPPKDYSLESEIIYCLEDEEKRSLIPKIIHGEEWLNWLDQRGIFDNIFSSNSDMTEEENKWLNWIVNEFTCRDDEIILQLIVKHGGYNEKLAEKIIRYIICNSNQFSNEYLCKMVGIFNKDIKDEWAILKLIEEMADRKLYIEAWNLFKKFYEFNIVIKNPCMLNFGSDIEYKGTEFYVNKGWIKIGERITEIIPKEILEFCISTFLSTHDSYCNLGMADDEREPWDLINLPIEENKENYYSEKILIVLIEIINNCIIKIEDNENKYLQELILSCIKSRSVVIKKIGLKMLRCNQKITANKKFEILYKNFDLFSWIYKQQIFLLIAEIYFDISKRNKERFYRILKKGEKTGNKISDAYSTYNWCIWIESKCGEDQKIKEIKECIKKEYPNFIPRVSPELNIVDMGTTWGDQSPKTEQDLLQMESKDLAEYLLEYREDSFDGPNRDGLLITFSNCIKQNYQWICDLIPYLKSLFDIRSDIWTRVYDSVSNSNMLPHQKYDILYNLSDDKYINEYYDNISRLMEKIVFEAEAEEIKKFENKIWDISNYIIKNIIIEKPKFNGKIVDLCFNTASSICVRVLIRMYVECDENDGRRYLSLFEEILKSNRGDKKEIICCLAGQFNYFYNRNKEWCKSTVLPLLMSPDKDIFSAAWEGYVFTARKLYMGDDPSIQQMYLYAAPKVNQLSDETKLGFIELYAILLVKFIDNPINQYISELYTKINDKERSHFAEIIKNLLKNMSDEEVSLLWERWLRIYLTKRVNNIPIPFEQDELVETVGWIFYLKNQVNDFLKIIIEIKIPAHEWSLFLHQLQDEKWYEKYPNETIELFLWIMDMKKIPNYILERIDNIINLLEKIGVDCTLLHEKRVFIN